MRAFYDNGIIVDGGEAVIDLNWFGGVGRMAENVGYQAVMVDTTDGIPFISEGIAVMAGTDQLKSSEAFVDWFGSAEFMIAYATGYGQVPIYPDSISGSVVSGQENAKRLRPQAIDRDAIVPKTDAWIQRIELDIK